MTALTRLRSTMLRWTMRFFLKSSKFSRRPAFSRDLAVAISTPAIIDGVAIGWAGSKSVPSSASLCRGKFVATAVRKA